MNKFFGLASASAFTLLSVPWFMHHAGDDAAPKKTTRKLNKIDLLQKRIQASPELQHFLKYASVIDENGEAQMTPVDFFNAMGLEMKEGEEVGRIFRDLFAIADQNHNGLLCYSEYVFVKELLLTEESEFKLAFQIFDLSGSGTVSKEEFESVVKSNTTKDFNLVDYQGLEDRFFADGKELNYSEFVEFLRDLKESVLKSSFESKQEDGTISVNDMAKIASQSNMSNKAQSIAVYMEEMSEKAPRFSFEQFLTFNKLVRDFTQVEKIMELHCATGGKIDKKTFAKVLAKNTNNAATKEEIDLVFHLFDSSNKGYLDQQSFLLLLESLDQQKTLVKMTMPQSLAMGGVSAMISAVVVFPIDKVKTLVQSEISSKENVVRAMGTQLKKIITNEGFAGIYRGLTPQLIGIVPEKALKLTVNNELRKKLRGDDQERDLLLWEEIAAGMGTGMFQVYVTNPIELLKIRMQIQAATGVKKSLATVIKETGFKGLYTGLPATMLRDIPFNMLYFSTYAFLKKVLRDENGNTSSTGVFLSGFGAGVVAAALDTPADTIKTRLQNGSGKYKNVRHAFSTIVKEEGVSALFRGTLPRVMIIAPLFSITFFLFEFFQRKLLPNSKTDFHLLDDVSGALRQDRVTRAASALETNYGIKL